MSAKINSKKWFSSSSYAGRLLGTGGKGAYRGYKIGNKWAWGKKKFGEIFTKSRGK